MAAPAAPAEPAAPELDAACVTHVLRFVEAPEDFGAALRVCRLWRACGADPALPFWRELDGARFRGLCAHPQAPRFCACAVVRAVRRLRGVLRRVDLSTAVVCDGLCLSRDRERDPVQQPPGAAVINALFCGPPLPALESLDLSCVAPDGLFGRSLADATLNAAQPDALPALRALRLTGHEGLEGYCLPRLWLACPHLEEIYLAGIPLLEIAVRRFLAPKLLRVNLLDAAPLPAAVDVACGVCGSPLLRRLTWFAKAPPTQPHITEEWYTNTAPETAVVVPMQRGSGQPEDTRTLNCARNCHAPHHLYLIDGGTGAVALHGWRFGIAVGAARGRLPGRHDPTPPLAAVTPSPPLAPAPPSA